MTVDRPVDVLVVDDDFMVARVHRGYVEKVPGFRVVAEAHSGRQALDLVVAHAPDLVLLDIYLPDMSGLEVLSRLRAAASGERVDVIAVTAARDVDTIRDALQGGVAQYVVKPFGFATLRDRLLQYVEARTALAGLDARPGQRARQSDVDRVFRLMRGPAPPDQTSPDAPGRRPGGVQSLPKGLSEHTADLVARVLAGCDGDLSAAETAERAGLSRVSARRYLEHLVETGQADLGLRYGAAGRPEHRYRWAGPR